MTGLVSATTTTTTKSTTTPYTDTTTYLQPLTIADIAVGFVKNLKDLDTRPGSTYYQVEPVILYRINRNQRPIEIEKCDNSVNIFVDQLYFPIFRTWEFRTIHRPVFIVGLVN